MIESIKLCTCFAPLPSTYAMLLKNPKNILKDFVGISFANLHETSLMHLVTKGFKGLIACAKCNRDCYDSELGFRVCFCFARGQAKARCTGNC